MKAWHDMTRDERLEAVRSALGEGISAGQAAERLCASRSAIIAFAFRHLGGYGPSRIVAERRAAAASARAASVKMGQVRTSVSLEPREPTAAERRYAANRKAAAQAGAGMMLGDFRQPQGMPQGPHGVGIEKLNQRLTTSVEGVVGVSLMDLGLRSCRAPLWRLHPESLDELVFCGLRTEEGESYCPQHREVCLVAPTRPVQAARDRSTAKARIVDEEPEELR